MYSDNVNPASLAFTLYCLIRSSKGVVRLNIDMLDSGGVKLPDVGEIWVCTDLDLRAKRVGGGGNDGGDCFAFFKVGGLVGVTFGESDGDITVVGGSIIALEDKGVSLEV